MVGQDHGLELSQWYHSIENIEIYKRYILQLFVFAKVRPVRTKVSDRQTDGQTDRQTDRKTVTVMDKTMAIGEILLICLKTTHVEKKI